MAGARHREEDDGTNQGGAGERSNNPLNNMYIHLQYAGSCEDPFGNIAALQLLQTNHPSFVGLLQMPTKPDFLSLTVAGVASMAEACREGATDRTEVVQNQNKTRK
jgi:hypothetical protein